VANLLSGKEIANGILKGITKALVTKKRSPKLVVLQFQEDPASMSYANTQKKYAEAAGIKYELTKVDAGLSQAKAESMIDSLNRDNDVTGIMLELPIPKNLNPERLILAIDPMKDAEGMHPVNLGKIVLNNAHIYPCTANAVMTMLERTGLDLYGAQAVCIGHSGIVGKPLSLMLMNKFATVSVCHIATSERGHLGRYVKQADVLAVAVGVPGLIKGDWIKKGAVVIDVGINKIGNKIVGDVDFDGARTKASFITPVPGGVGPLTTAMLMRNVYTLSEHKE